MAQAVVLGSEALFALAHATRRAVAAQRARAILTLAYELGGVVRIPAPVLAEVFRGGARDAAVDRILGGRGLAVIDLSAAIARHAGALLAKTRSSSAHAVDAFVVATAAAIAPSIIATHDPDDLRRLAANVRGVRIWAI